MVFLYIEDIVNENAESWTQKFTQTLEKTFRKVDADSLSELADPDGFSEYLQSQDVDMLFISVENNRRHIQGYLNACRSLRIPYIFLTDTMRKLSIMAKYETGLHEVLAPVTMLEEEVHKAELLRHLMRFTGCNVTLLQAKDYGHKAARNVEKIQTFLRSNPQSISGVEGKDASVVLAYKDSTSLYKEVPERQRDLVPDLLAVTASRDYGLDDLIFGPAERFVIRKAQVPVALLNPRGDLFSLCD